ncbi:MAG TPA: class I SAM-dependent methyltransferase, partial [Ktedonobacterales bacterium]|nr:class I SAM-dependent methyltransferase [Ktedonobacterales bacterium]
MTLPLTFTCPACGRALDEVAADELRCDAEGVTYRRQEGVWRLLAPAREEALARFISEYETVRRGEGRGATDAAYYRALPFSDLSGKFSADWAIRAASFRALLARVVAPLEDGLERAPVTLDLGAGCGWLSYRLAQRGHTVLAVDLQTNATDGLGAHQHYDASFVPVQAEFDRLPLAAGVADLVVFNAALHYATDYVTTLTEALRVLRHGGIIAILDSPVYSHSGSGQRMVREREADFSRRFGFPSNAIPSEQYLTGARLRDLAAALGLRWRVSTPAHGVRFAWRRWKKRLIAGRESA